QMPINAAIRVPFGALADFAPHEEQLLAGEEPLVTQQRAQVGEALPVIAGHAADKRPFTVNDFVMRKRKNKILVMMIKHRERKIVLMETTEDRITLEVVQRVMHPAHVPL